VEILHVTGRLLRKFKQGGECRADMRLEFWYGLQFWSRVGVCLQIFYPVFSLALCIVGGTSWWSAIATATILAGGSVISWVYIGPVRNAWFLWSGPIICFDAKKPHVASAIRWLEDEHPGDFTVMQAGVIKFRRASLAILFKVKCS
jgi:hypothetical protein